MGSAEVFGWPQAFAIAAVCAFFSLLVWLMSRSTSRDPLDRLLEDVRKRDDSYRWESNVYEIKPKKKPRGERVTKGKR